MFCAVIVPKQKNRNAMTEIIFICFRSRLKIVKTQTGVKSLRLVEIADDKLPFKRVAVTISVADEKLCRHFFEFFLTETELISPLRVEFGVARIVEIVRVARQRQRKAAAETRIFQKRRSPDGAAPKSKSPVETRLFRILLSFECQIKIQIERGVRFDI